MRSRGFTLLVAFALAIGLFSSPAAAQTTVTTTTLSSAVTSNQNTVQVVSASTLAVNQLLFMDREAMLINAVNGTVISVQRGYMGSGGAPHVSGVTVYSGAQGSSAGGPFWAGDPNVGSCTYSSEQYSLRIVPSTGRIWACSNGQWMNVVDAFVFVSQTSCNSSVSGNGTGTNGYTVKGTAPSIPVVQAQTDTTSTNTHYFMCNIPLPTRLAPFKAAYVVDVEFYYGVQTTALGTQVATLASGTMNSKTVFTTIAYPTPAASETATGLAEATRADSGTLTITPVVASFNTGTTTAGQFYSAKFTPSSPIAMSTDRQQLLFTISLLNTATSATITNSPGFVVHYRTLQLGI